MPIRPLPYLIVYQDVLDSAGKWLRIFVCMNLIDHRAVGIATTRDESLDAMTEQFKKFNPAEMKGTKDA